LPQYSWRAFGSLAGSWIGGTGNLTAAHAALDVGPEHLTMAAAADQMVYLVWLILMVTLLALLASTTPVRKLPGAHPIAMAIIYVYAARIEATMDLSSASLETMGAFVLMAMIGYALGDYPAILTGRLGQLLVS
jgi:uncharacterized membrane protein